MHRAREVWTIGVDESILVHFDLHNLFAPTESIGTVSSLSVSPAVGLDLGAPIVSGDKIQTRITATSSGDYVVMAHVVSDKSNTMVVGGSICVTA
jgi:hypothetical protein